MHGFLQAVISTKCCRQIGLEHAIDIPLTGRDLVIKVGVQVTLVEIHGHVCKRIIGGIAISAAIEFRVIRIGAAT